MLLRAIIRTWKGKWDYWFNGVDFREGLTFNKKYTNFTPTNKSEYMKKGLKDNEYLYLIAKSVNSIEVMFFIVILAKMIMIGINFLNEVAAVPMP